MVNKMTYDEKPSLLDIPKTAQIPPNLQDFAYIRKQRMRIMRNILRLDEPLIQLLKRVRLCSKCPGLVSSRKLYAFARPTFGFGHPKAPVLLIGQSPGWRGCGTTGFPFEPKSRTGRVFEEVLKGAGLRFEDVWTTNLVKCCPRGSEHPAPSEISNCSSYLLSEIKLINPFGIIAVGKPAHRFVVKNRLYRDFMCRNVYHPGFILRKGVGFDQYVSAFSGLIKEMLEKSSKKRGLESWF